MAITILPIREKFFGYKPAPEIPTFYPCACLVSRMLRSLADTLFGSAKYRNVQGYEDE